MIHQNGKGSTGRIGWRALHPKEAWERLRGKGRELVRIHDSPHAIAGGTALGIFFGFTPFFGLKTLLAMGSAWGLRCSYVAAAIGVALHDLLIPLMPVIFRIEYGIGYWILGYGSGGHHWPQRFHLRQITLGEYLHWEVFPTMVWPMFLGSLVLGLPLAALVFWGTLRLVDAYQKRHPRPAPDQEQR